jgi:hypothetical protein
MRAEQWSKRLKREGRWTILVPLCLAAISVCIDGISWIFHRDQPIPRFKIFIILIPTLMPGVVLWLAGCFLESFARDASEDGPRDISVL